MQDLTPIPTFIADDEENVAYHAITAFGRDASESVVGELVRCLNARDIHLAAAASEALRIIGTQRALDCLIGALDTIEMTEDWILATIGRFPSDLVHERLAGSDLLHRVAPILLLSESTNWLAREDPSTSLAFLLKQHL